MKRGDSGPTRRLGDVANPRTCLPTARLLRRADMLRDRPWMVGSNDTRRPRVTNANHNDQKQTRSRWLTLKTMERRCAEEITLRETEAILPWSVRRILAPKEKKWLPPFHFLLFSRSATSCVWSHLRYSSKAILHQSWARERKRPLVKCGRGRPTMAWGM